jgi:hypothetical protein
MDQPTIHQTTSLSGSGSIAVTLGQVAGPVNIGHLGNVQVMADSPFFDLDQEGAHVEGWPEIPSIERLVDLLAEQRLLILAGPLDDKPDLARHLAFQLRRKLVEQGASRVVVRERWRGREAHRIEAAFEAKALTIVLLPEISQSQIAGYDPAKLGELLCDRDGYAVVTTDSSRKHWAIGEDSFEARFWQELSWERLFGRQELARYLKSQLASSDLPAPENLFPDGSDALLIAGVSLTDAAEKLKSPRRIRYFVESLLKGHTLATRQAIESRLAELAGDPSAIRQWYEQFEPRDQLLALGLVLLDGLPEDLLFAGLEILVETTWRGTDPLLAQFDYRDLARFSAYFKESRAEGGLVRIESGSRERRRQILEVAWHHQRRRLLATLPALTRMIRFSAAEPAAPAKVAGAPATAPASQVAAAPKEKEKEETMASSAARALGRTESGSVHLHQVLVESLSLIALLSLELVEPYLLDLAADPMESVQQLVAGALAVWREQGRDAQLFALLRRWWVEGCSAGNAASRIARVARLGADPRAAVRATVALAVGYAAQYDREDHLKPPLEELLGVLLMDADPRVRGVMGRITLPHVVKWHLRQLEPLLRTRILVREDFADAVARGAAAACELRPEVCLPTLETWRNLTRSDARGASGKPVASRELLLGTVALTYGYIQTDERQPRLSSAVVLGKLRGILTDESHPTVRRFALWAVEVQTRRDFALAAQLLQTLLARVTLVERPAVIQLAVRTYLHQRQQLAGGDQQVDLGGHRYPVWTSSVRPLTGLEASLYSWILDDSRPVGQQLAVDIFSALAGTELEREERRLRQARPLASETQGGAAPGQVPRWESGSVHTLSPLGQLSVWLATPRKPQLRPVLRPLLAELIVEARRQRAAPAVPAAPAAGAAATPAAAPVASAAPREPTGSERVDALLARWVQVRNAATQAIADYLGRALGYYRWRWALVLLMALALVATYRLGSYSWDAWMRHRAAQVEPARPMNGGTDVFR